MVNTAGTKNLKPIRTKSEAKERGRNGGLKSGENRRARKAFKLIIEDILKTPMEPGKVASIEDLKSWKEFKGANLTVGERMLAQVVFEAMKGNLEAFKLVRDQIGETPSDAEAQRSSALEELAKAIGTERQEEEIDLLPP